MIASGLEGTLKEADARFVAEIDWENEELAEIEKKVLTIYGMFPDTIVKNIVKNMYEAFASEPGKKDVIRLPPDMKGVVRRIVIPPKDSWNEATSWTDEEKKITYPQIPETKFYEYLEETKKYREYKKERVDDFCSEKIEAEDKTIVDDDIDDITRMLESVTVSKERKGELEIKRQGLLDWREFKIAVDRKNRDEIVVKEEEEEICEIDYFEKK